MMKRFLALLLLVLAVVDSAQAAPKNIVLFVTDDQGQDAGCYGNPKLKTPHLDALAADAVRFDNAFCTTASCSASRSVILTGMQNHANAQYGHEHVYHHFRAYDDVESLPVMLQRGGYRTGRVGKLHVGPPEVFHFQQTFKADARNPVAMADACREFIAKESERPFFLYFCTADPHRGGEIAIELRVAEFQSERLCQRSQVPKVLGVFGVKLLVISHGDGTFVLQSDTSRGQGVAILAEILACRLIGQIFQIDERSVTPKAKDWDGGRGIVE